MRRPDVRSSKNNLRQLAIAVHTHHDARGACPTSRDDEGKLSVSWAYQLLPYLEHNAIHSAFRKGVEVDHDDNVTAMRTPVASFFCEFAKAFEAGNR